MKLRKIRAALAGLAVCTGLGCGATQVRTEHDPHASFARYHTFALRQGRVINDGWLDKRDTLVRDRIDTALRGELSEKGLEPTTLNPDLIVAYTARTRTIEKVTPNPDAYALGPMPAPWLTAIRQRTLVIDFIDPSTNKVIWRSVAQTEGGNTRNPENIEMAVDKALKKFPTPAG